MNSNPIPLAFVPAFVFIIRVLPLMAGDVVKIEDAEFETKLKNAATLVQDYKRTPSGEDPQPAFADEFFQYHQDHPDTITGRKALREAFHLWAGLGDVNHMQQAMSHIDASSEAWIETLSSIRQAYYHRKLYADFNKLMGDLENRLTHPNALSEVLMTQGDNCLLSDPEKARAYYNRVVDLQANPAVVERARNNIYAIESLAPGQPAPDFSMTDIHGNTISLSSLKGKVVLLDFWATWCGPCVAEMPNMKKVYARHQNDPLVMIGMSLDRRLTDLQGYVEKEQIGWSQIQLEEGWNAPLCKTFNIRAVPTIYLIDREGKIVSKSLRGEAVEKAVIAELAK